MTEENKGLSRRTVVKGAAWSVPVIAAAVATPLASASTAPTWNGTVTALCANDYDLSLLESLVGAGFVGVVQGLLKTTLNLDPGATRQFTITATTGDIPAGTTYTLMDPNAILTIGGLTPILAANAIGVVSTAGGFTLTLGDAIAQGDSVTIDLWDAIANVGALSSLTLVQGAADANNADNSATLNTTLGAAIDLSTLGLFTGSLAIQVCG